MNFTIFENRYVETGRKLLQDNKQKGGEWSFGEIGYFRL